MKKTLLIPFLLLLFWNGGCWIALADTDVRFVNTGAMNVNGIMYVQGDMQMKNTSDTREVQIVHDGTTALTGSFYHDARKNVFVTENNDWKTKTRPRGITGSIGTFKFIEEGQTGKRYISTLNSAYNRMTEYIAFPNLTIETDDEIFVPEIMGLDARTIIRDENKEGILYLASHLVSDRTEIYDASLRITGDKLNNGNYDYTVTTGSVVIEKYVKEFRETTSGSEATILMPFAAPFTNMRSGYFAGNWVRRPLFDETRASYYYPYGNADLDGDGFIDREQYVIDPLEELIETHPYLIRLQKEGSSLDDRYSSLNHTSIEDTYAHDKEKFIIHGEPYQSLVDVHGSKSGQKIVFRGEPVLSRTPATGKSQTQNWLVGNSYTSGLNAAGIAAFLMNESAVPFSTDFYIYHHGATAYTTYGMWDWVNEEFAGDDIPDIHAMSVFMICVWENNSLTNKIEIGPEYQVHTSGISPSPSSGNGSPGLRASMNSSTLSLLLTPEDNPFVYDRTSIRLTADSKLTSDDNDLIKLNNPANRLFQIYGTHDEKTILQENALPLDAEKAQVSVRPAANEMDCILTAENVESIASEVLLLYDKKLDICQDLREENQYRFLLSPGDEEARFEVYFTPTVPTGMNIPATEWYAYVQNDQLQIKNLKDSTLGSIAKIHTVSGKLLIQKTMDNLSECSIAIGMLPSGVYLFSLEGKTMKFIK